MISAFGVDHGISKAAWKAWYPVPPKVGKIPRSRIKLSSKQEGDYKGVQAQSRPLGGRPIGVLATHTPSRGRIDMVEVAPGFRRRGVASHMLAEARKLGPVSHSPSRSRTGEAWAKADAKKRGRTLPRLEAPKESLTRSKHWRFRAESLEGPHGILRQKKPGASRPR